MIITSAKSISIVTVSIFGSVFLGIFLSNIIFSEDVSLNSEGTFASESSEITAEMVELSSSTTIEELEEKVTQSSSTRVE